ncbi:MAG: hypothetical protein CMP61_00470 [Flavobacteriales bacterium]|nr:hypothetical protein [Flavobacteriales bacterium]|tara:strand:- start:5139 stop:5942 length:804 start_codon:yes stop_codon:yes gene_type:complete
MATDYQERSRKAAERRKKIRLRHIQEAIKCRDNHFPTAIAILSLGVLLIVFRILISVFSSEIEHGSLPNSGGIIGPFEISSSQLHSMEIEYDLRGTSTKWCALDLMLLDENKNYVGGCTKDVYHEVDVWRDTYHEEDMEYVVEIEKPGTYYYQFFPKHNKKPLQNKPIQYELSRKYFGTNFLLFIGVIIMVIGGGYLAWTLLDWELTPYLPDLKSDKSKKKFKLIGKVLGPLIIILIILSVFRVGYADLENAPSSYFDDDNTIYFGK